MVIASLLTGGIAFAKQGTKTIQVMYSDIKIYIDGVKADPKDATGAVVEPFIYNGTTYLPVRAIGEALGKNVDWDGATQSVYLGTVSGKLYNMIDLIKPYVMESYEEVSGGDTMIMGGTTYRNGFTLDGWWKGKASFNLNGQYKDLSGIIGLLPNRWQDSGIKANIFADDKLIYTTEMEYDDLPQAFTINVAGVLQLRFETSGGNSVGFADLKIRQ